MTGPSPQDTLDLLITGGTLLTMNKGMETIEDAVVGIRAGRIVLAGKGSAPLPPARERINASGCAILPGLVNTHAHLAMVCFRGMADDLPLLDWLTHHIWPAESRYVNREMVYAGSTLAMAEMILSGTTTFCDAYFYAGSVARAAVDAGMRGVVSQGFIDFATPDNADPVRTIEIAEKFTGSWKDRSPLVTPALFCHTPHTCSAATLRAVKEVSRRSNGLFLTHLSESKEEVAIMKGRFGKRPVEYLDDLDVLDERTVVVHCTWLEEEEMDILAARGVKVSHNPESNMKLASGFSPIPAMLAKGIVVGLGTDGAASNNDLDLFGEIAAAAKIHKAVTLDPTVMDARTVLRMATIEGASVLGLADRIGSVEVGKDADLILVDMDQPHLTPLYNLYSQLVYAARGSDVQTSIINGRIVMRDRKLLNLDLPAVMAAVREIARRIAQNRKA